MAETRAVATHKPRTWISAWLLLSSFVVAWDVGYILLRPRSMKGGDLHWIWSPYALYMDIDYVYGLPSWDTKDGFPAAQSLMNVAESILNLFYIYLAHVKGTEASLAVAPVWGLVSVIMTLSKTVLYVLNDYCCSWCKTGHNDFKTLLVYWILPNGLWILFPAIISFVFIREIRDSLQVAAGVKGAISVHDSRAAMNGKAAGNGVKKVTQSNDIACTNPYLIDHHQLPAWAQDNGWIVRGYRRPGGAPGTETEAAKAEKTFEHNTVYKCWRSVWAYWHNETVNIHTHMWGVVFSFGLSGLHLLQHVGLLPSFIRPLSHHPIFYPSSLTFTTATGKVLRLASASYPTVPDQDAHHHLHQAAHKAAAAPSIVGGFLYRLASLFASSSPSSSSSPSLALSSLASKAPSLAVRPPDMLDVAGFGVFFFASVICLGFSATYHTIQCHSEHVSKQFNKLDYVGIVVMIVGSFLPALHYGFYCHPEYQILYSVGVTLLGAAAMYTVIAPRYATPAFRPYRTAIFVALGLSAVFPVAHVVHFYGYDTITQTMGLRFLITSGALYVVGALLYALRIPERFAPGRFDLLGASHQIFHVLILAAAAAHYISLRRAYGFWHTVETLGGTGKEGVCKALEAW
ncbi:HlyIII-domain-containing protein [Testicularia cyperi]|uniref:HlyIII-domain-containing protein n=1 Tax=Testicularia cyperi TaxID=1882483 RepID=A0A317XQH4_9BASI|nr:HlyIII-domain-containing protein [Testicularia cyperi]